MSEKLLSVGEARAAIQAAVQPVQGSERLALDQALGRVSYGDLLAPFAVPAHDNSAMDGWAVRASDLRAAPVSLREIGTALAGHPCAKSVGPGECVRIMTGAIMPPGADTVVMQEAAAQDGELVTILAPQAQGSNVRLRGEDLAQDAIALPQGTLLRPTHLGLAASLGQDSIAVYRRLCVAYFSTGDELHPPGARLSPGGIYDSNGPMLSAMLRRLGCQALDLGIIPDDPARLEEAFCRAAQADAVITSGGVSAGDSDFTRERLMHLGAVEFWKIAIKPGKPMAFGRLGADRSCMLFALPGNPFAVLATFTQFVRGALLRMMGCTDDGLALLRVRTAQSIAKKRGRTECLPGRMGRQEGEDCVRLFGPQSAAMLSPLAQANCLVILGHDQGDIGAGDWVNVLPFEGLM